MKWAFALKPQDQSARLRHFSCVIFNGLAQLKRLCNLPRGNIAFKHTLHGMKAEDDFWCIHLQSLVNQTQDVPAYFQESHLLLESCFIKFIIHTLICQQLRMRSLLYDFAVVNDNDLICAGDR